MGEAKPYPVAERAFHVVRSSDGVGPDQFIARDRATLVGIPSPDRESAYAMADALNRAVSFHVARAINAQPRPYSPYIDGKFVP